MLHSNPCRIRVLPSVGSICCGQRCLCGYQGNTQVNSQGDTTASAYGWTNISTSASGPKATTGRPGAVQLASRPVIRVGFFAVSVAVQNVFASIRENASANSGGNLTLSSMARERVKMRPLPALMMAAPLYAHQSDQ